jgi:Zn finger protein HypA/HybF involved in hydrogenase expression
MKKSAVSILFRCPQCRESFEFDMVGENEFVPCPICGTNCVTVKKGRKLLLQTLSENQNIEEQAVLA